MSKITIENKKGKITIVNKLSHPEVINERAYSAVATGMVEGILPVAAFQKKSEIRMECTVQGLVNLRQYFNCFMTRSVFLDLATQFADIIKNCDKHMINSNNLDLRFDMIFVDPKTRRIQCVLWPIVNNQRDNPPYVFLRQLPLSLQFDQREDCSYLEVYKEFFNRNIPFSINSFERMLLRIQGKPTDTNITPSGMLSGALRNSAQPSEVNGIEYDPFAVAQQQHLQTSDDQPSQEIEFDSTTSIDSSPSLNFIHNAPPPSPLDVTGDGFMNNPIPAQPPVQPAPPQFGYIPSGSQDTGEFVYCIECGWKNMNTSNFCEKCGTRLEHNEAPSGNETTVLGYDSNGTIVVENDKPVIPTLVRLRTNETYNVNVPTYRIGSERNTNNLCITDNTYISRFHAEIHVIDGRYYLVDKKSTNKTYVDGKMILAEQRVEIFSGTKIRFANDDFIFNIES